MDKGSGLGSTPACLREGVPTETPSRSLSTFPRPAPTPESALPACGAPRAPLPLPAWPARDAPRTSAPRRSRALEPSAQFRRPRAGTARRGRAAAAAAAPGGTGGGTHSAPRRE